MSSRPTVDQTQIDALLRFLPAFKRQGFWFERVVWEGGQISDVEKGPEARMFLRTLRDNGWLLEGSSWRDDPEAWVNSSTNLRTADLATLQRLFTSWVERDRLLPGHLGSLYERGDLTAALERLEVLRGGADPGGPEPPGTDSTIRP